MSDFGKACSNAHGKALAGLLISFVLCFGSSQYCLANSQNSAESKFADKWALIIGCGDYSEAGWSLKYAIKDTTDFSNYLTESAHFKKDHIKILTGPNAERSKVMAGVEWLGSMAKFDDLAVVFVRCRGTYPTGNSKSNYLALTGYTPETAETTGIRMQGFEDMMVGKIKSKGVAAVIDADFSGNAFETAPPSIPNEDDFPDGHVLVVVSSAYPNEISWESERLQNGIFTHELIHALRSKKSGGSILAALSIACSTIPEQVAKVHPNRSQSLRAAGMSKGSFSCDIKLTEFPQNRKPASAGP